MVLKTVSIPATSKKRCYDVSITLLPASPNFQSFQGYIKIKEMNSNGDGNNNKTSVVDIPLSFRCQTPGGPIIIQSLRSDMKFQRLWQNHLSSASKERLARCMDVGSFSIELEDIISSYLRKHHITVFFDHENDSFPLYSFSPSSQDYLELMKELDDIEGWSYLESVKHFQPCDNKGSSNEGNEKEGGGLILIFKVHDDHQRVHELMLEYRADSWRTMMLESSQGEGFYLPHCHCQLPEKFEPPSPLVTSVDKSPPTKWYIKKSLQAFQQKIVDYQSLWEVLDDLDRHSWVLGSNNSNSSSKRHDLYKEDRARGADDRVKLTRRVVLGPYCSVILSIDAQEPYAPCNMEFIGPESLRKSYHGLVYRNVGRWDRHKFPRENLEVILEVKLPLPPSSRKRNSATLQGSTTENDWKNEVSLDCAICYAYELQTASGDLQTPTQVCENHQKGCARAYHPECLGQWLVSLPPPSAPTSAALPSRRFLTGSCPYCTHPISVAGMDLN